MEKRLRTAYIMDEQNHVELRRGKTENCGRLQELDYACYMMEKDAELVNDWTRKVSELNR